MKGPKGALAAEEALQAAEARYRQLFDQVPVGLYESAPDGTMLAANKALADILGYPDSESMIGLKAGSEFYVFPEERAAWVARLQEHGTVTGHEMRFRRRDGRIIWVRNSVRTIRAPDGSVSHFQGAIEDVTDRREAESALAEQSLLAALGAKVQTALTAGRTLREALRGAVESVALDLGITLARVWTLNPAKSVLELQASAGILTRIDDSFSNIPVGSFKIGQIAAERRAQLTNRLADDPRIADPAWVERERIVGFAGFPLIVEDRLVGVLAVFSRQPISGASYDALGTIANGIAMGIERVRAEEGRRRTQERLQAILEHAPAMIYLKDLDGRYLVANRCFLEFLGFRLEDVVGKTDYDLFPAAFADGYRANDRKALESRDATVFEETADLPDGPHTFLSVKYRILDSSGVPYAVGGMSTDITERKRAEAELRDALARAEQGDRLKSAFLANVSHEIRTPLNVMVGFAELLCADLPESERETAAPAVDAIRKAGKRILDTMHAVLDLSRIETRSFEYRPEPVPVAAMIEYELASIRPEAERKGLFLTLDLQEPRAVVSFDEYCLTRALHSVLENAVKFTASGGVIVRLARGPQGGLEIEVRDTGVGIDVGYLSRLFEPFSQEDFGYTRQFEGSGLGLALTKRFLGLGAATISAESKKGHGSSFTIRFDRSTELTGDGGVS